MKNTNKCLMIMSQNVVTFHMNLANYRNYPDFVVNCNIYERCILHEKCCELQLFRVWRIFISDVF